MKNIKKIFSVIVLFAMSFMQLMPLTVNADEVKGSITINKTIVDETYSIYKVLDLETFDAENGNYIYRAAAKWKGFIEDANAGGKYLVAQTGENSNKVFYTWKTGASAKNFSEEALKYAKDNNISYTKSKKANATTVVFDNLDLGYYLVESSLGALCNLTTTKPNATINEKNTIVPDVDKVVKENSTGNYGNLNDASIGDAVEFKATVITGAGYDNYVLYDKMDAGLTLNSESIVVKIGNNVVSADNYTLDTTSNANYTFKISFKNEFISKLPNSTKIDVYYSATLNENAVVEGNGNKNETYLEYGNKQTTDKHETTTYTYAFDLKKTNKENEELTGAEFILLDVDGNEIKVVLVDEENNIYRVAIQGETGTTIKVGHATINGLDAGSYKLEEVVSPVGYNKLTSPIEFTISTKINNESFARANVNVINYTGSELPETGGMGTTLLITIGSLLVIGFGLLLVTKLRVYKENI